MVDLNKYVFPDNILYTKNHFWVLLDGKKATVGITEYAANETTEIMYIELPKEKIKVKKDQEIGVMESVKTAITLYSPFSGEIIEINQQVKENPGLINASSYDKGWLFKQIIDDEKEFKKALTNKEYFSYLKNELSYLG